MRSYADVVFSSFKEIALFNVIGGAIALVGVLFIPVAPVDAFGFVILIESTGLMLVGGAMGVAGQATTRRITEWATRRKIKDSETVQSDLAAALYAFTGGTLFAEAFVLSVLLH